MRRRDDAEFDEFVLAAWPSLFRASYLLMGDFHLAEDVLQSALAKVYAAWPRVSAVEHPRSYTRTVLTNEAMAWWRRKSSTETTLADWPEAPVMGHEESVVQASMVWQALCRLPPRQRAVIVLRYYEELSEVEIARTLGISTGSVKSHAHHAIRAMSGHLGPQMEDTSYEGEQA